MVEPAERPLLDPRVLLLSPLDNVVVVRERLAVGDAVVIEGQAVSVASDVPLGHKLARHAIAAGQKILKYGAPIGVATHDIAPGEPVHVHNVRSDYTPTYHLLDQTGAA